MKLYKIYFSPTGGTKKIIDAVSDMWSCEKETLDLFSQDKPYKCAFNEDDICIVAVPSFGGRVPALAIERMQELKGNKAKTIFIAVYGNRDYDDTLLELKDTLENLDFCCIAGIAAIAEHSIFRQFATNRPDDKDIKELKDFAKQIQQKIQSGVKDTPLVKGNHPYKKYGEVPLAPKANNTCTNCGICAAECPVKAIPKDNPRTVDKTKCIACMHCISVCPNHSRVNNKILTFVSAQALKKSCGSRKQNQLFLGK